MHRSIKCTYTGHFLPLYVESCLLPSCCRHLQRKARPQQKGRERPQRGQEGDGLATKDEETLLQKLIGDVGFGAGIAYTHDLGREDRIKDAAVVNDVVRVTHRQNASIRVLLETHAWQTVPNAEKNGHGPFIGIQASATEPITAFAIGWMFGMKRTMDKNGPEPRHRFRH